MERQAPNVARMRLFGADVAAVASGDATLRAAIDEALRAWVQDPDETYYLLGSAVGPHPYPFMVREFQSVIGREARRQCLAAYGRLPDVAVACVGGGSNAIGLFAPFADTAVELVGVEAGGDGTRHGASMSFGTPGVLHGSYGPLLQDRHGQVEETHSVSAGLDYPGVGPEHALLGATGRARYTTVTDDEALAALTECSRLEGILPALETAHALAAVAAIGRTQPGAWVLVGLSGRGDKDLETLVSLGVGVMTAARLQQTLRDASPNGLVAYLTAGFPSMPKFLEQLHRVCEVADAVEVGVPFTDPMADGPILQDTSRASLEAGFTLEGLFEALAAEQFSAPLLLMSYLNPLLAFGITQEESDDPGRLIETLRACRMSGVIVPDLPLEEGDEMDAALVAAELGRVQLVAPTTPPARGRVLAAASRGFVYAVTACGPTGGDVEVSDALARQLADLRSSTTVPVLAGFGVRRRSQVEALRPHADGVIVGSALMDTVRKQGDAVSFLKALRAEEVAA